MRNIALFLTYEGTAYHGWQTQKNLSTVQQTLEKAIEMIVGHDVHLTGCGRTDAGVMPGAMWRISAQHPRFLWIVCPMR